MEVVPGTAWVRCGAAAPVGWLRATSFAIAS